MAGAGAKRRVEDNKKRLETLRWTVIICSGAYVVCRLLLRYASTSWLHWLGLLVTLAAHGFSYHSLSAFAEPLVDSNGELIDGGGDLSQGGVTGYYHDLIYITAFVQVGGSISDYLWMTYLLVPGYGCYLLWTQVIKPYMLTPRPVEGPMDDATKKRLEKAEKRAERRRGKWR